MKSSMGVGAEYPQRAPLFEVLASLPARPEVLAHVDADALVEAAARHGLSAVLADALAASGHDATFPSAARARLLADARGQISRGLKHKRLVLSVVDALAQEQVTPVLIKGYALAQRLYPQQPLARPSTDVDVLVTTGELDAARRAMARLGLHERRDASLADVFEEHHHLAFVARDALVEVHFRLFSGFGGHVFDDAAVRSRLCPATCEGRAVWRLAPEDEFLYLATHAANHSFLRVSWLVDLQRYLLAEPTLDWERMGRDAHEAGFASAVGAALWLLEAGLGVVLPPRAARAFALPWWRRVGHRRAFSLARVESAEWSAHRVWGFALRLWLVDSPRDGVRHALDGARRLVRQLRERS
jgi:hypothetical protein